MVKNSVEYWLYSHASLKRAPLKSKPRYNAFGDELDKYTYSFVPLLSITLIIDVFERKRTCLYSRETIVLDIFFLYFFRDTTTEIASQQLMSLVHVPHEAHELVFTAR